jgi:formylglycine-generating enzyme required for sulfatase activity
MVLIPAGSFLRGVPAEAEIGALFERPQASIYLDAFYMDKHEVTVFQYQKCVKEKGCTDYHLKGQESDWWKYSTLKTCNWGKPGQGSHPINCVNWGQARAYCKWAGKRLPTEAEWEKAARGTDGRKFPWGNEKAHCGLAVMSNWNSKMPNKLRDSSDGCGKGQTWPVGSKSPAGDSPYGLQDMAGNVTEFVNDWFDFDYYKSSPVKNPSGPATGTHRACRGGSFYEYRMNWLGDVYSFRGASRGRVSPMYRGPSMGFRCASTP